MGDVPENRVGKETVLGAYHREDRPGADIILPCIMKRDRRDKATYLFFLFLSFSIFVLGIALFFFAETLQKGTGNAVNLQHAALFSCPLLPNKAK